VQFAKNLILGFIFFICFSSVISGDQFHYLDIHVGERASGLAGAFSAISDDPSGAFYNPAGLAFTNKSYFSVSTNTFSYSKSTYFDVFKDAENENNNWESDAASFIPNYFGLLQDYEDFKIAFSFIIPEGNEFNQDNLIDLQYATTSNNKEYLRNYNEKTFLYLLGPSVAFEINDSWSVGGSLFLSRRTRDFIDNQRVVWGNQANKWEWSNLNSEAFSWGTLGVLGLQYMPSSALSFGLTIRDSKDFIAEANQQSLSASANGTVRGQGEFDLLALGYKSVPASITSGMAYFFSPYLLWTADVHFYPAHKASNVQFSRKSLLNFATGIEYYASINLPIRFGLYTNNSTLNEFSQGAFDVDMLGLTFALGYETEFSSLSLGIDYSFGRGQIAIPDADKNLQFLNSEMQNFHVFFSGSYMI
jgi:long-subunit fatty acid transport protein